MLLSNVSCQHVVLKTTTKSWLRSLTVHGCLEMPLSEDLVNLKWSQSDVCHSSTHTQQCVWLKTDGRIVYGSMSWVRLWRNMNWTTTNKHTLARAQTHILAKKKKRSACNISLSRLLWTERPQLFSFQTKGRLCLNIKHMLAYLMVLYSDYKRGREGMGEKERRFRDERAETERKKEREDILMGELLKLM